MADVSAAIRAPHAPQGPRPLGGPLVTPLTVTLALLSIGAGVVLVWRLFFGLGAVTNINDGYPWGVWIVYDVFVGTAFACGGYAMALLAYVFNKGEYHPLVRPALLASLFGYTLASVSILFDLGRWWNFWHVFFPGYMQPNSVMFEVALCVTAYVLVMWIEFAPAVLDRWPGMKKKLSKVLFVFIALGVLLPTMHQSSLGSLLLVFGYQVHPLWQSGWLLPLIYLMTAIMLGYCAVIFEATLSAVGFRRHLETGVLGRVCDILYWLLIVFLVVRVADLVARGALATAFVLDTQAVWFWIETALFVAPAVLLAPKAARRNAGRLFLGAVLLMAAGMLQRVNGFMVGYMTGDGWHYFPSLPELLVTVGLIAFEVLAYIVIVRRFPVLPAEAASAH
ncbi:MAG TPA: Ni/Fe-hydrogenase cytochrome b subunit [Albitalea sp.]|nr:Ni/Fe-hydrogenase cytochrome b subunit [Albitalea sp.]